MLTYHHLGVWKQGDVLTVRFGDHRILDEIAIEKIGNELYGVADREDCQKLLLNFSSVERLSSLMLGKLLMVKRKMEKKGGKLIVCEVGPEIQEIFSTTRLDQILNIRVSEADALRAFAC